MDRKESPVREYRLIDADSHTLEPPHIWDTWLPKKFQNRAPQPPQVAHWLPSCAAAWTEPLHPQECHARTATDRAGSEFSCDTVDPNTIAPSAIAAAV